MGISEVIIITGAFLGGLLNGMTGFGAALTAVPIWLLVLPPTVTAPLAAAMGLITLSQTMPSVWRAIQWRYALPLILFGSAGAPVGALLVPSINVGALKVGLGAVLILYGGFMLFFQGRFRQEKPAEGKERLIPVFVGFSGGLLGGLAGFSGPPPIIWTSLKDWTKEQKRGVCQIFNFAMLALALGALVLTGRLAHEFYLSLAFAAPATLAGAGVGRRVFLKLNDRGFDHLTLGVLFVSGLMLMGSALG